MIPIIITARRNTNSPRCPDKLLREFDQSRTLMDICLSKLEGRKDVYLASFEPEFKVLADKYHVNFLQRTQESSTSEETLIIHNYLKQLDNDYVCFLNPCCPLIKAETIDRAIDLFSKSDFKSLFSVKESHELIFNQDRKLINQDRVFNSKIRRPSFVGNNAILIFSPKTLFSTGSYWDYTENHPYLYEVSQHESFDIDTELDFVVAQAVWRYYDQ